MARVWMRAVHTTLPKDSFSYHTGRKMGVIDRVDMEGRVNERRRDPQPGQSHIQ
jgi:hypothetical protein